ncbi:hypothetical protein J2741_001520 [Methanolinea mesophila]|uniref:hypothetical protein n=1 Tax=Methanolinea mesophila TaxID=547055 RepID=UPI001AE3942A|nr:hypothetical protein [Methanolinea mesophila]MBP1928973.1 hypothetical protein [Methanolinea mesophila]
MLIISMAVLLALFAAASADTGIYQAPETQGFVTSTISQVLGTVTETDSIVWQLGDDNLIAPPLLDGQIIAVMSYTENTIADQGLIEYTKGQSLDTAVAVAGIYNFDNGKTVDFIGLDTGRMTSDENMVLDTADYGYFDASSLYVCPFVSQVTTETPGYCNIIEMGSAVDVTLASLATAADERHVMDSGDPAVAADYYISMTGFGDVPAMGSASAYINAHLQEARVYEGDKAEDVLYSETSTAAGEISVFAKEIAYQSGIRRY